jgi:hypothetical protein
VTDSKAVPPPERREAPLETLAHQMEVQGEDAKARGYLEAWNTYQVCANMVRASSPAAHAPARGFETLSTLSLRELMDDLEPGDRARVEYEQLLALLDTVPRPHRVTPPALRGEPETLRCSGCGTRWTSPEGFILAGVVHLCGDCWRKVQPILHASPAAHAPSQEAPPDRGWFERQAKRAQEDIKELPDWLRSSPVAHATKEMDNVDMAGSGNRDSGSGAVVRDSEGSVASPVAHAERPLQAEAIQPDERYLHHLREAAYDWAIESIDGMSAGPRRACVIMSRNVLCLVDELRKVRAALSERAPEPTRQE